MWAIDMKDVGLQWKMKSINYSVVLLLSLSSTRI